MSYTRKTRDEWQVVGNYGYGHGYECVDALNTYTEARASLKVYKENERDVSFKIVKKRVKIEA